MKNAKKLYSIFTLGFALDFTLDFILDLCLLLYLFFTLLCMLGFALHFILYSIPCFDVDITLGFAIYFKHGFFRFYQLYILRAILPFGVAFCLYTIYCAFPTKLKKSLYAPLFCDRLYRTTYRPIYNKFFGQTEVQK